MHEHCVSPACQSALVDAVDAASAWQSSRDATHDCRGRLHAREAPSPLVYEMPPLTDRPRRPGFIQQNGRTAG